MATKHMLISACSTYLTEYYDVFPSFFPRGYRVLIGELNKKGMMILQDEPDGTVYNIPIQSKVDTTTGRVTLTIDFSVKGGPKDVDATLNILESRANDKATGLTFPDGNIWKRLVMVHTI